MTWQEFILKIVESFFDVIKVSIWPICILGICFYFRKPLHALLTNSNGLKLDTGLAKFEITSQNSGANEHEKNEAKENIASTSGNSAPPQLTEKFWLAELVEHVENNDLKSAEDVFKKYEATERDKVALFDNKAYYLYYTYTSGVNTNALQELKIHLEGAKNQEEELNALIWYTMCLDFTKQYNKSILLLDEIINNAENEKIKSKAISRITETYILNDETEKAKRLIIKEFNTLQEDISKFRMCISLSKIEDKLDNKVLSSFFLDKALEYDGTDENILFDSAFKAEENSQRALAISNYSTLIELDKTHSSAFNNLAVCAKGEKLDLIANRYYYNAADLNESLSLCNLGYALLEAGFADKAKEMADLALKSPNPHTNAHSLLNSIDEKKREQFKIWEKVKADSNKYQRMIRKYISSYLTPPEYKIQDEKWKLPSGKIVKFEPTNKRNEFNIEWEDEIVGSNSKYFSHISIKIKNSSFSGDYLKYSSPPSEKTLLGLTHPTSNYDFYGVLDNNKIMLFASNHKKDFKFILSRIND
ncbi:tetratricopeptide repeat protein [Yersinia enterocolitica]|uniref:tetratricopeptide repeat protein n=1 Tax=Yersinia enterocolitica TaxID=630 RepID=UPI003D069C99